MPRLKFAICHLPFTIYFPFHNFKINKSLNKRACFLAKLENKWKVENGKWKMRPAFTMIELLVAIAIIGILSSIGYVNFDNARDKGRDSRRKQDLAAIKTALVSYYQDHDAYPPDPLVDSNTEFSSDSGADPWIPDLASSYIQKLPKDP